MGAERWSNTFYTPRYRLALTAHIPNAGEHLVRYSGWYSNASRGKRRKTQEEAPSTIEDFSGVMQGSW